MGNPFSMCTVDPESADQKLTGSRASGKSLVKAKDPSGLASKEEKDGKSDSFHDDSQKPHKTRVRDPKHVFDITFTTAPLGVKFTSSRSGKCIYVTDTDGEVNKAVKDDKLPKDAKLLRVNNIDVESQTINETVKLIRKLINSQPVTMSFCHPDGLDEDECQDPDPQVHIK